MIATSQFTYRFIRLSIMVAIALALMLQTGNAQTGAAYPIVDTGQTACYNSSAAITCPAEGQAFYGQDAQVAGNTPNYTNNGDGTITDNVTGLMWQKSPDTNGDGTISAADKLTYAEALAGAETFALAGHDDWRLPTIKELYSLIDFSGLDPSGFESAAGARPFINTDYFDFGYGDVAAGERIIDAQYASGTLYVATTMGGNETVFGVNFADGRIKGYPVTGKTYYVLYVRGNPSYGQNSFVDNGDPSTGSGEAGTITDAATGLMWSLDDSGAQNDSGTGLNWEEALAWVAQKNAENYLGYSDWRLPNAKELQSIVDYTRAPDTTGSAAIDPLFNVTAITNEAGQTDYPAYWSSTTHASARPVPGSAAVYVAFGRAMGYMHGNWIDVHGAGAQRSDPKSGDPADYATGHGPQGDAVRIYNYVRLVRDADAGSDNATPLPSYQLNLPLILTGASTITTAPAATATPTASSKTMQSDGQPGPDGQPPNVNQQPGSMPSQPNGPGGQPPQEAIAACNGQTQGASCQFTAPHGVVMGTCNLTQLGLACVPAGRRP